MSHFPFIRLFSILSAFLTPAAYALADQSIDDLKLNGPENLGYFAQKVRDHHPVTIAYLGGSITVGTGASAYPNNYYWISRTALLNEVQKRGDTGTTLNAGIGGTGSSYGAFRVGAQVLSQNPDLLIVEFAVNDAPQALTQQSEVIDGMEGIVRQALKQDPKMGIVFLYTSTAALQDNFFSKGLVPPSIAAHHMVALHYGIAEALTGPLVAKGIQEGNFTDAQFFRDGTHPTDIGHALYAKALTDIILPSLDQAAPTAPKPLPPLLGSGKYEYAHLTPITPVGSSEGWTSPNEKPWNWPNVGVWISETGAKPLSFAISGKSIQLVFMGQIDVQWTTDGQKQHKSLSVPAGLPMPGSWDLTSESVNPDKGLLTVEAIPAADGKAHGEVWGIYSIQGPN
jgi:acyl-CoA thioesterase-1